MRTDVGLGKGHRVGRHEPILPVTQGGREPDEVENGVLVIGRRLRVLLASIRTGYARRLNHVKFALPSRAVRGLTSLRANHSCDEAQP
jgi:hypothetical protein